MGAVLVAYHGAAIDEQDLRIRKDSGVIASWNYPERAATRAKQFLLSAPVCTDDYGNAVYRCQFTGDFTDETAILAGAFLSSVSGAYVCSPRSREAYKESRKAFDESEANCNTCSSMRRLPHKKRRDGMVEVGCLRKNIIRMTIHPDDPMHMECWSAR